MSFCNGILTRLLDTINPADGLIGRIQTAGFIKYANAVGCSPAEPITNILSLTYLLTL